MGYAKHIFENHHISVKYIIDSLQKRYWLKKLYLILRE